MINLKEAAPWLPTKHQIGLVALIDPLVEDLDLAMVGRSGPNGWSNFEVIDFVATICGSAGLITWFVQP